jgi:hypothetical protein
MYDAAGVRQAAGKQAKVLNQIIDELFQEKPEFNEDRLKELLGHTPFQVIAGSILGVAISGRSAGKAVAGKPPGQQPGPPVAEWMPPFRVDSSNPQARRNHCQDFAAHGEIVTPAAVRVGDWRPYHRVGEY